MNSTPPQGASATRDRGAAQGPFQQAAQLYFAAGWLPMPLPPKAKKSPPTGYTGHEGSPDKITPAQVEKWMKSAKKGSNICARPRADYIGIDVDYYKVNLAAYEQILADVELPDTWISSARDDGKSGIRHYRLPAGCEGLKWPGSVAGGVDFIHVGYRYSNLPPSVHPDFGLYKWYPPGMGPDGNGPTDEFPGHDELRELPVETIEYFTKGRFTRHLPAKDLGPKSKATKSVSAWIERHDGEPCAAMLRVVEGVIGDFDNAEADDNAHDTACYGFYRLACLAAEGHPGLSEVASRLEAAFLTEVGRDDRPGTVRTPNEAEGEWLRLRDDGVKKVMYRDEAGEFEGHACSCRPLGADGRPKPIFDVTTLDAPKVIKACYTAMAATAERAWLGAYYSAGKPHIMTENDWYPLDSDTLLEAVMRDVDFIKWVGGEEPRPVVQMPPGNFLSAMVKSPQAARCLPELHGVVHFPFFARINDKPKLIHENGYHPDAKVFLQMDPQLEEAVANADRWREYLNWAQDWIDEVFVGFPLVGDADWAHVYAALIVPFVRKLIDGPIPLHLITAPAARTGKTKLGEAIAMIICGVLTGKNGYQKALVDKHQNANEELDKSITALLRQSPRVVLLDNISKSLDSPALAETLTSYPMRVIHAAR